MERNSERNAERNRSSDYYSVIPSPSTAPGMSSLFFDGATHHYLIATASLGFAPLCLQGRRAPNGRIHRFDSRRTLPGRQPCRTRAVSRCSATAVPSIDSVKVCLPRGAQNSLPPVTMRCAPIFCSDKSSRIAPTGAPAGTRSAWRVCNLRRAGVLAKEGPSTPDRLEQ